MKRANLILMVALAAAGLVTVGGDLVTPTVAVAAESPKASQKLGPKIAKPLAAVQDAIDAKNWDLALAKLAEVQAIEPKTPYESFVVDERLYYVKVQKQDYAGAAEPLARAVAAGFYSDADLLARYLVLTEIYSRLKQYPQVIEYGKKAIALEPGNNAVKSSVAAAMYYSGDYAGARSYAEQTAASMSKPTEQLLRIILSSNVKLNDRAGSIQALESLIRNYPSQAYWKDLLGLALYETKSDRDLRALYRLMVDTNTISQPEEYSEMANALLTAGFPNEAKTILERGLAANVFTGDALTRAQADLQRARSGAETDRKDLPGADAALAAAKTGREMVAYGKLFFSSGEYAKAADAFRKGLAKGGVTDVDDANALLGIALARNGNDSEALEAFAGIKDPKFADVARLWKLYVEARSQVGPSPPSTN
jgi:tetratricopeptide (TPR) repeat protein